MRKQKLIYLFSALVVASSIPMSYALSSNDIKNITLDSGIMSIINAILALVGLIAILFIIIGGVRYVTASGNPDQIQSAKNSILYGVIGLIAAILAFAIVNYVIKALVP